MKSEKYSYDFVKGVFTENGCVLLSEEYISCKEKLSYICVCGEMGNTSFTRFRQGVRCNKCAINKRRSKLAQSYEYVKGFFEENGCLLLEDEYRNSGQKLRYICSCGKSSVTKFGYFKSSPNCRECGLKKSAASSRFDFEYVKKYYELNGCVLLEKEYKNSTTNMQYTCSCGKNSSCTFGQFKRGVRCRQCFYDRITGEGHPSYNHDLSEEERITKREYTEYRDWRISVFERDNFTCRSCGKKGGKLNAHHIYNYAEIKELRTDVRNGVTLCQPCHTRFHRKYGYRNNNEHQLLEYIDGKSVAL